VHWSKVSPAPFLTTMPPSMNPLDMVRRDIFTV
jgi:hypothetical protein